MPSQLSIVVPALNEERYIGACLESIFSQNDSRIACVFVLLSPQTADGTAQVAAQYPVTILIAPAPGTNAARDFGMQQTSTELVAFIDADCRIDSRWLDAVFSRFEAENELVCLSGPYDYYELAAPKKFLYEAYIRTFGVLEQWIWHCKLYGGNFVITRQVWKAANGFDKTYEFFGDDVSIGKVLSRFGKVRFIVSFRVKSSGRRFNKVGFLRLSATYIMQFLKLMFKKS